MVDTGADSGRTLWPTEFGGGGTQAIQSLQIAGLPLERRGRRKEEGSQGRGFVKDD